MITISRRQARKLRGLFRRHRLGIAHKGPVPPLHFIAEPGNGLRVRHHQADLAVECVLPADSSSEERVAVPLDVLADVEGRDETPVILEATAPDRTVARWEDRSIPQSKECSVPDLAGLPPFPERPGGFETYSPGLPDALAEAAAMTDDTATRYALDCILLKGDTGKVVATDGRQILIQSGFRFPWDGDLLVRRTPLFASLALSRDRPVEVGRTDTHVAIRAGDWTVWLTIRTDARFPSIENAIPDVSAITTRLQLDAQDAVFLDQALDRLPGADVLNSPATLDLNGRVAVRARGADQARVTELVLARSGYTGTPVRVSADRHFLAQGVRLGFTEIEMAGAGSPVVLRNPHSVFCFQPLSEDSAIEPSEHVTLVESTSLVSRPVARPVANHQGESTVTDKMTPARPPSKSDGTHEGPTAPGESPGPGSLAALIQDAKALHETLSGAKARAGRLVVALRSYRRRERLVSNTLASLKALKLQEVAK